MKWYKNKIESFDRAKAGVHGKRNHYLFNIKAHTIGWEKKHVGWYVLIEDLKSNNKKNSLWDRKYWKEMEDAKKWCEEYADKNENNRI